MSYTTDISHWCRSHAAVRYAVASILYGFGGYEGKRCKLEDFITPLNVLAGVIGREDIAHFNEGMIVKAFQNNNNTQYFADCIDFTGFSGTLHICMGGRMESQPNNSEDAPVFDIALFPTKAAAVKGMKYANKYKAKYICATRFRKCASTIETPDDIGGRLREFLRKARKSVDQTNEKSSSKKEKKQKEDERREKDRKRKRQERDDEEQPIAMAVAEIFVSAFEMDVTEKRQVLNEVESEYNALAEKLELLNQHRRQARTDLGTAIRSLREEEGVNSEDNEDDTTNDGKDDSRTDNGKQDDNLTTMHYYLGEKIGRLEFNMDTDGIVAEDLLRGLVDVPIKIPKEKTKDGKPIKRRKVNFKHERYGENRYCWVPSSHVLTVKNRTAISKRNSELVKTIEDLFNTEISQWGSKAQRIFTALNTFGYGCSDDGSIAIMAGTLAALFEILNIDISGERILKSIPGKTTIARMEVRLAVECLIGVFWEMKEAGVTDLGLTTDHGHRKGQDHLVKLLSYPVKRDDDGRLTINFLCLNIDSAGHTTEEASHAISEDVKFFLEVLTEYTGNDVKLSTLTGDAGGGASVQLLHSALKTIGIMDNKSN